MSSQGSVKRIVVALGGNALGNTRSEQQKAVCRTAKAIVDLVEGGNQVIVTHGNGPQVGMIQNAMEELVRSSFGRYEPCPLSVCVAMSQAYIGFDLQNALREELSRRSIDSSAATVVTQVVVSGEDEAFDHPTKPIGPFLDRKEAEKLAGERNYTFVEDSGRGYRRVVPSPKPISIVEIGMIRDLVDKGQLVIACGGGGIPVLCDPDGHLRGVEAVIDKDFVASVLAQQLQADMLVILTAVEKVSIHFGEADEAWLDALTPDQAECYIEEGHFAPGSMLPKMQAAVQFSRSAPGRCAVISSLNKARDAVNGKTGTVVSLRGYS